MIAGVILAAGESRRMGKLKPLLRLGQVTVIERVIQLYLPAVAQLYVVLGHERQRIEAVIRGYPVRVLVHPGYRQGMLSSVQHAVRSLPSSTRAMLLALADQPLIRPATIRAVVEAYAPTQIVIPCHGGRRGHPVLIPRKYFSEILELGEQAGGLRALMRAHPESIHELPVDDPGILKDMDTPQDYQRIVEAEG